MSTLTVFQNFKDAIIPAGAIDGTNTVFTLPSTPSPSTSLILVLNGLTLTLNTDYSLSGTTITFLVLAPQPGDSLFSWYREIGYSTEVNTNFVNDEIPAGVIDGTNVTFTLAHTPNPVSSVILALNGVILVQGVDYTLSGTTITFSRAPQPGDLIIAQYRYYPVVTTRFGSITKASLLSYIRFYLNDINGVLWSDSTLLGYINQCEADDLTPRLDIYWQKMALALTSGVGLYQMPINLKSITRITYRGFYVDMLTQTQMALLSPVYRTQISRPRWATLQYEGYYALRLYPVPAENLPVISDPSTIYTDVNIQNECHISAYFYATETNPNLIIPDYLALRTIRYYVLWKAFVTEGLGQDQAVGERWKARYEAQIVKNKEYLAKLYSSKARQYTDVAIQRPWKKARPILPPNFGTIMPSYM